MRILKNYYLPFIIFAIAVFLSLANYQPNTFLSGWDTLHPEFNFALNFKRLIFGVFRSNQGLGAVAAHSQMSDLAHFSILYFLHFFFSINLLRYLYIFLNLIAGPVGMYFLLKRVVIKKEIPSFLGALFYLLNLGTMQQFFVPFEMFTTQYAVLPWLFLFAFKYLASEKKLSLYLFLLVSFLATPMAYAATLWYVFFLSLSLFLLVISYKNPILLKRGAVLSFLSLLLNSFWLLPNLFFVSTEGKTVPQAVINKLFSPQAFLYNKEFGDIKDIALLKTFYFDWAIYTGNNHFSNLLTPWIQHLQNPVVLLIGFSFAIISFSGFIYTIYKRKRIYLSLFPILLISLLFLFNDNPPVSFLYHLLQRLPLFSEAFRFPDDKVLGLFTFVFSLYFAFGQLIILNLLKRVFSYFWRLAPSLQLLIFSSLLIFYMLPGFKGYFISPFMRIKIPQSYFAMFSYLNKQKDTGRIANLPINSFWGWQYYNWYQDEPSFQGAGFIWFGIKQPLLNRDFDRWSPYNEQYYQEMSYAIYNKSFYLLSEVIKKYNIHYLLLDTSIVEPQVNSRVLFYPEIQHLLENQGLIAKKIQFGNNLFLYHVRNKRRYVYDVKNAPIITPQTNSLYEDFAFQRYGDYLTTKTKKTIYYPFRNIIDNQGLINPDLITLTQEGIKMKFRNFGNLYLPSYIKNEELIPADIIVQKYNDKITINLYPHLPFPDLYAKPSPLIINAGIPSGSIMSLNQTDNFSLKDLPDGNHFSLGTVYLKTQKDNTIALYSPSLPEITPDFSKALPYPSPCENIQGKSLFGVNLTKTGNGLLLFAKNIDACAIIPLQNILPKINLYTQELLDVSFYYKGETNSSLCLADLKTDSCLNYTLRDPTNFNTNQRNYYFGIKKEDFYNLGLKISLDADQEGNLGKASYTNFKLSLSQPIAQISFPGSILTNSLAQINKTYKNEADIKFSGRWDLSKKLTSFPKTRGKCYPNPFSLKGSIKKTIFSQTLNQAYIRYFAENGSVCDHFSYQNLKGTFKEQAYVLAIKSRNIKGLPLTLCLLNQKTRHCDLYSNLSKSSSFTTDFFLIPPSNTNGYDIDIGSLGIKHSPSINDLSSIQIVPFPYYFLSKTKSRGNEKRESLFISSYSYNPGWHAYLVKTKDQKSKIKDVMASTLPFLFGKELKNHVLVNNWENGWIIPNTKLKTQNAKPVVIFLPQYLEYLGFLLLVSAVLWLARMKG